MSKQLAAGESALALVPGNADAIREMAHQFDVLADGLGHGAIELQAIEAGTWRGEAGDAFRRILEDQPTKFRRAAASFGVARTACLSYVDVLERAQQAARRAVEEVGLAEQTSSRWRAHVQHHATLARRAAAGDVEAVRTLSFAVPPVSQDPGHDARVGAQNLLAAARAELQAAGARAALTILRAARDAPDRPGILKRVTHTVGEFVGGFGESVLELVEVATVFNPARLTFDPWGLGVDVFDTGAGVLYGVAHPVDFAKVIWDWDTWKKSPARALGHLAPDLALALGTAGAGTAVSRGSKTALAAQRIGTGAERIGAVSKQTGHLSSGQDMRQVAKNRRVIAGGDFPPGFTPGDGSPAAAAAARQGAKPGVVPEQWSNTHLQPGDVIAVTGGSGSGASLGPIAVPVSVADRKARSRPDVGGGLQERPDPAAELELVRVIRVNERVDVAAAQLRTNPSDGPGDVQIFIPDLAALLARNAVTIVEGRPLEVQSFIGPVAVDPGFIGPRMRS